MSANNQNNQLALIRKDVVDVVENKVREFQERGELHFPANYSPENAMKAAWLILQETVDKNGKPVLETCTRDSVANSLLNMVVQGLNPMKKQCYFIAYGNLLQCQRSYFGTMYLAKLADSNIEDINPEVIYIGDEFDYAKERGRTVVVKHIQKLENVDKEKIVAAYCSVFYKDGTERTTIMTIDEIYQAWRQSKMHPIDDKGKLKPTSTHYKFTQEMAKRTVVNRACKSIINSSGDSYLMLKAYRETENVAMEAAVEAEIAENANIEVIDVPPYEVDGETGEVTFTPGDDTPFPVSDADTGAPAGQSSIEDL